MNRPVEPYGFIFNRDDRDPSQDVPLTDHEFASYAPFMSALLLHSVSLLYQVFLLLR